MKIINPKNQIIIADRIESANGFFDQLKGLIGRKRLDPGYAMILPGCKQIHTFLMKFPIDVLFLDKENVIIHIYTNFKKNKISKYVNNSINVIELPIFTVKECRLKIGDMIKFEYNTK